MADPLPRGVIPGLCLGLKLKHGCLHMPFFFLTRRQVSDHSLQVCTALPYPCHVFHHRGRNPGPGPECGFFFFRPPVSRVANGTSNMCSKSACIDLASAEISLWTCYFQSRLPCGDSRIRALQTAWISVQFFLLTGHTTLHNYFISVVSFTIHVHVYSHSVVCSFNKHFLNTCYLPHHRKQTRAR